MMKKIAKGERKKKKMIAKKKQLKRYINYFSTYTIKRMSTVEANKRIINGIPLQVCAQNKRKKEKGKIRIK